MNLKKYKVTYNHHKYTDSTGPIRIRTLTFEAKNPEEYIEKWRSRPNVGMIHWDTLKEV